MDPLVSWQVVPEVVARRLGESVVLVNLADDAVYELNRTGARTIELIQSGWTYAQIIRQLEEEFIASPSSLEADVTRLVGELVAAGLITPRHV
jgi:hypothetical protein